MANILVIDDDAEVLAFTGACLRRAGHAPVLEQRSARAVGLLDDHAFDLVVTDMFMPAPDGLEILASVLRSGRPVPVIVISGGGDDPRGDLLTMSLRLGAVAVVRKPFAPAELSQLVQQALRDGTPVR